MFNSMRKKVVSVVGVTGLVVGSSMASAAVDLTPLTAATTDIVALGAGAVALALAAFGAFALYARTPRK